jgi:hypothetical protein
MMDRDCHLEHALAGLSMFLSLLLITACGTLELDVQEPNTAPQTPVAREEAAGASLAPSNRPVEQLSGPTASEALEAAGWYGQIKGAPGADEDHDFLKLWHLAIWPKFGKGVGITGEDPAITAEIERLRDRDVSAAFWGRFVCGVADYGDCQLRVTRIAPNDGGPSYDPDPVIGWEGQVGQWPSQPGSENQILYFVLDGEVPVLYGLAGADPAVQAKLEELSGSDVVVRLWGELQSRAQPVTGTLIVAERLEVVEPSSSS